MAITFVGSDSGEDDSNQNNITLTLPSHQADDFGIINMRSDEDGTVPTLSIGTATGWTQLFQNNITTGRDSVEACWYKKFTSSSEANPVMQTDTSEQRGCSVHVFRGVDTTTPFDVAHTQNSGTNNPDRANPAITPVTANGCLFLIHNVTANDISAYAVSSVPSGQTLGEAYPGNDGDPNQSQHCVAYKLDYGAAATISFNDWNNTYSSADGEYRNTTIALRPAVATIPPPGLGGTGALGFGSFNGNQLR